MMNKETELLCQLCDDGLMSPVPYYDIFLSFMAVLDKDDAFLFTKNFIEGCRPSLVIKESKDFVNIKLTPDEFKKYILTVQDENLVKQLLEAK